MNKIVVRTSTLHGQGVFSTVHLRRCEVIHRIDDTRVVDEEHPLRPELGEDPIQRDWLPDGTTVLMKKPAGFFNHSCDPNVFVYSIDRQRFVLAMRDICPGEELFFDYSLNAVDGDVWECRCGASFCRQRHKCDFFFLPDSQQREYLPFLDPWFVEIHRPRIRELIERSCQCSIR